MSYSKRKYPSNYNEDIFKHINNKFKKINNEDLRNELKKKRVKDYDEEKKRKQHEREEDRKDLQHNLIKDFSGFFSFLIKMIVVIYVTLLFFNIVLKTNYDLSKLELIVYTFLTTSLGVLLDRTFLNKE